MDYLNKIRSTVTSVAATVSNALPGNPVLREYEVVAQIASAGPGLSWKIYSARKNSTKQVSQSIRSSSGQFVFFGFNFILIISLTVKRVLKKVP
jgi:hypothetical protein